MTGLRRGAKAVLTHPERLVELAGGSRPKVSILEFDWKGKNPYAVLDISWQ